MQTQNQINTAVQTICNSNKIPTDGPVFKALIASAQMRAQSKQEGNSDYGQTIYNFQRNLDKDASLQKHFLQVLDEALLRGGKAIDVRAEILNTDKAYHKQAHQIELAGDSKRLNDKTTFKSSFIGKLAEVAAACHDIVQEEKIPIMNEIKSKAKFVEYVNTAIDIFLQEQQQKLHASDFQNLHAASQALKTQLPFIGNEIIVNGTYLVTSPDFTVRKPLLHYVTEVDKLLAEVKEDKDVSQKYSSNLPPENRNLYAAATIVSLYDTSRTLDKEVGETQIINNRLAELPAENQHFIADLFEKLSLNDKVEQELFLARLTQNIRMFPETNKFVPDSSPNKITPNEMTTFTALFKASFREQASSADFLAECGKSNMDDIFKKFIGRVPGEISFAKSLDFADHQALAKTYQQENVFKNLDPDGWKKHAEHLNTFQGWYNGLNNHEKNRRPKPLCY
jgi:hypothetical protein